MSLPAAIGFPMSHDRTDRDRLVRTRLTALIRLGRLEFLPNSALLVLLGVAIAVQSGHHLNVSTVGLGLGFSWCTHLMGHYSNDYFDLDADRSNTTASGMTGGSGVLTSGLLRPRVGLVAALALLLVDSALLALMPTTATRIVGGLLVVVSWAYTCPPPRLNYRSLGELSGGLSLGILFPALSCLLQTGILPTSLPALLIPLFVIQTVRMTVMNLADSDGDRQVGKYTVPVVLGRRPHAVLFTAAQVAAYGLVLTFTVRHMLPIAVGVCVLSTGVLSALATRLVLARPPCGSRTMARLVLLASIHVNSVAFATILGLLLASRADATTGLCWIAVAGYLVLFLAQTRAFLRKNSQAKESS